MRFRYAELHTAEEFEQATDVEIAVWGLDPRDAVPGSLFRAVTHNGGVLIGAFDDSSMVGIAFGFYAHRQGRPVLWSHMAGVLPSHQGQGIGEGLKLAQRDWAIAQGIEEIRWTFDPLQRGNANFNLARLGAFADTYHVNHYGTMNDAINAGLPSDRVEACWTLTGKQVAPSPECVASAQLVLTRDAQSSPLICALDNVPFALAEVPTDVSGLRLVSSALLLQWRLALRSVLMNAFAAGYVACGFTRVPGSDAEAYLLKRLRD